MSAQTLYFIVGYTSTEESCVLPTPYQARSLTYTLCQLLVKKSEYLFCTASDTPLFTVYGVQGPFWTVQPFFRYKY